MKQNSEAVYAKVAQEINQHRDMPEVTAEQLATTPWRQWTNAVNARPFNWFPKGALDTLQSGDDGVYIELVLDYLDNAVAWCEENDVAYPAEHSHMVEVVIGESLNHAPRLIHGHLGEVLGADFVRTDLGRTILPTPDAMDMKDYESVTAMENDGVDFVTADGETWQVKAEEDVNIEEIDADHLIKVVGDTVRHTDLR